MLPDWHVSGISRINERKDNVKLMAFRRAIEGTLVLALNPALVSAVSKAKQPVKIPTPDCSDFADWLKHISTAESLARQEAEQSLATGGLPGFRVFQADPSGDAEIVQCIFQPKLKFRLDELSYGQIALIILETAVAVAGERNGVLMLDEPGNFLGLSEIQPLLTRLQDAALEGRFQVIVTAHHPLAVDFLAAGHGLWLEREPSGPTRVHPIRVAESVAGDKAGMRVSDLIARGWLSGLGLVNHGASSEGDDQTSTKMLDGEPHP
jgi:predicted ATPase